MSKTKNITERTLCEHAEALSRREYSSLELTRAYLENIKMTDASVGAFLTVCADEAQKAAKKADVLLSSDGSHSPLCGIPFAVKDNICTRGIRTTCASRMLEDYIPPYSAEVVLRLEALGAPMLGKTDLDEFAMGSSTENSALGATKNPLDLSRCAGGSSGGSAAAVAAYEAVFALGTDTGGSVRQPAAFCGTVGLCPTYGRVSRYGLIAFASSLDRIGAITRTVSDCELVFCAISGQHGDACRDATLSSRSHYTPTQSDKLSIKNMRIGLPSEFFGEGVSEDVRSAVMSAARVYESMGAKLIKLSVPSLRDALCAYYVISSAEASSNLARFDGVRYGRRAEGCKNIEELYLRSRSEGFGDEVKRRIMLGTLALSKEYYGKYYQKALALRDRLRAELASCFESCDILLTPTAPTVAHRLGIKRQSATEIYMSDLCTVPSSIAHLPALSVPCGRGEGGMPVGMQLIAPEYGEELLFFMGKAFENAKGGADI